MSSKYAKGVVKSTWTPLNHEDSNVKVFEERRSLVNKWFEMWNTNQRKMILEDLLLSCTGNQVEYAKLILTTKAVQNHVDFTRLLPRVVCLYIFSFLDPRSLCRASQVCWYWKYLAEANEIWAPKCARLGWYFTGPINTMESGLWKKHFIENIHYLQIIRPAKDLTAMEIARQAEKEEAQRKARRIRDKQNKEHKSNCAPWRGPDPKPIDIVRNNYIENDIENGARIKSASQKLNQKFRKMSYSEHQFNGKEKSQLTTTHNSITSPTTVPVKIELEPTKPNNSLNIEPVRRPTPIETIVSNGSVKTNVTKTDGKDSVEKHDDIEIPSGRPWILPTEQEDM